MTGGLCAALVYYKKEKLLRLLFRKDVQWAVYVVLAICLITGVHVSSLNLEFYGLFFGYFILNVSSNTASIVNLEYSWISYLGKISYGIYIYQTAFIVVSVHLIQWTFGDTLSTLTFNLLLYPLSALLTIGVSALSYRYFETPFLTIKNRFSKH